MKNVGKLYFISLLITLLPACSGGGGGRSSEAPAQPSSSPSPPSTTKQPSLVGSYAGHLITLNPTFSQSHEPAGNVFIGVTGDTITIDLVGTETDPSMTHIARIYTGTMINGSLVPAVCPPGTADLNADKVIDVGELTASTGLAMLNIGKNLNSIAESMTGLPTANSEGYVTMHATGSVNSMLTDALNRPAPAADTGFTKLDTNQTINFENAVVVVFGVTAKTALPVTTSALSGLTSQQSLPIMCGTLTRFAGQYLLQ